MARNVPSVLPSRGFTLALVISAIAVLYLAQEVLIPFSLAVLLSFLLSPLVNRLQHWHMGRVPSVVIVVVSLFLAMGLFGWIVTDQLISLADNIDSYKEQIEQKAHAIKPDGSGVLGKLQATIFTVSKELADTPSPTDAAAPTSAKTASLDEAGSTKADDPVPVEIVQSRTNPFAYLPGMLGSVVGTLATTGVVILFVFFMLIEREDLRNRLVRLIGPGQLTLTTEAMDDAARRVSSYLLMQLLVNSTYGLAVAIGLYLLGVPNAILWGLLSGVLRYIPYLGAWIAALMPVVLSIAVFPGWSHTLLTIGLFIVLELLSNNIMEPLLYRNSTGISTLGILVSAVFWTWLWGSVGLVLATPLTVCIAVLGRYVPQLEFLNTLLSDEPMLEPGSLYYQRLLAGDLDEAGQVVDKSVSEHARIDQVYDAVLLPALALSEQDAHRGHLQPSRLSFIQETLRDAVDEIDERAAAKLTAERESAAADLPPIKKPGCILCLPARDDADELAADMLSRALQADGRCARYLGVKSLASEMLEAVEQGKIDLVFVSAVPPFGVTHARYLCKRLRAKFPNLKIIVGLWQPEGQIKKSVERLQASGADKVVTTIEQAVSAA